MKSKKLVSVILALILVLSSFSPVTALAASENDIRNKIFSVASSEVGYKERSSGVTKYGDWYGYQGGWCTTFVLWCYNQAGNNLGVKLYGAGVTPTGGNCNSMISWYTNKGRYHKRGDGYTPKKGDLVFFDWSGNGSSQHVGIVNYVSGSTVYTVEGNCSGQVKSRSYTSNGSKPYNNVSAIMGYASPNFSGASSGESKPVTKATTTKAPSSSKPKTTSSRSNSTKKASTSAKAKTTTSAATTTTAAPTEPKKVETLTLTAKSHDMSVGDTIKLGYRIEPSDTQAVVGYFCDEEGIIQIDNEGDITAIGSGNATVVVCVNDELYSQCSFNVSQAVAEVTSLQSANVEDKPDLKNFVYQTTQRNAKSILTNIGMNVDMLSKNKAQYIIPISIIGLTTVLGIIIFKKRNRKNS